MTKVLGNFQNYPNGVSTGQQHSLAKETSPENGNTVCNLEMGTKIGRGGQDINSSPHCPTVAFPTHSVWEHHFIDLEGIMHKMNGELKYKVGHTEIHE